MSSSLAFDTLDFNELPRGAGGTGATEAINQVLHDAGLDAPASLYDEALTLARDGRLAPAAERLQMLMVLDPSDAEAALLLGKVLAGMSRWQEALTWLDAAAANGAVLPAGLRDEVEVALRQEVEQVEAERQRLQARERGELRSLRTEAKRLRSDNAALEQQVSSLDKRVKMWSGATALVAGSASALLLLAMVFGGPEAPAPETTASTEDVEQAVASAEAGEAATTEDGQAVAGTRTSSGSTTQPKIQTIDPAGGGAATASVAPSTATPVKKKVQAPTASSKIIATHTVQPGDNLSAIASEYYGRSSQWRKILNANEDVLHGSVQALRPGQELKIPE